VFEQPGMKKKKEASIDVIHTFFGRDHGWKDGGALAIQQDCVNAAQKNTVPKLFQQTRKGETQGTGRKDISV